MVVSINQTNSFNVTLTEHSTAVTKIINSKAYSMTAPIFSLEQLNRMLNMCNEDFKLFAEMQTNLTRSEDV